MSESSSSKDKMRICPTCRMEISVFASKCRFCGEAVGRPRDEARTLTVDDLGGMSGTDYAPSEEVLDALEAFRREEFERKAAEDTEPRGFFRRWRKRAKPAKSGSSFAELDPRSRELASIGVPRRAPQKRYQPVWTRKLAMGAGFVAAVVLLYFGGRFVKASVDEYLAHRNQIPVVTVENRALEILESGSPLEALEEAVRVLKLADTPENQKIADTVRQAVAAWLRARLNADIWSDSILHQIEEDANRASTIDPHSTIIQEVKKEVREEVRLHTMTFSNPNPETGTVTLRLMDEQRPTDTASIGEKVHGRFEVMNITRDYVRFKDHARNTSRGIPRQFVLDKYGSFVSN